MSNSKDSSQPGCLQFLNFMSIFAISCTKGAANEVSLRNTVCDQNLFHGRDFTTKYIGKNGI